MASLPAEDTQYPDYAPQAQLTWRYQLLDPIGRGATAVVWSAWDGHLKRVVALKLIRSGRNQLDMSAFEREARLISALEHPHIVPLYDFGFTANTYYLATRYLTGGSLADRLTKGALAPADAMGCLARVALALDYVHDRNILHRDLKPGNILLDVQGMPYLADFGLAKPALGQLEDNSISGTPYYMAPEQLVGQVNAASDVFAFGVMLFQVLTGTLPFEGKQALGMVMLAQNTPLPAVQTVNAQLPAALDPLLAQLTSSDPTLRPPRVVPFLEDIASILGVRDKLLSGGTLITGRAQTQPPTGDKPYDGPATEIDSGAPVNAEKVENAESAAPILAQLGMEPLSLTQLLILDRYFDDHPLALLAAQSTIILETALHYDRAVGKWGRRWLRLSHRMPLLPRVALLGRVTARELSYAPIEALHTLIGVSAGSIIAFALQLYAVIRPNPVTGDTRMLNAAGNGLLFGLPIGLGLFVGIFIVRRLRVLPFVVVGTLGWLLGSLIIAVTFVAFARLFYLDTLDFGVALLGALLYSAGFVWAARQHPLIHALLGIIAVSAGYLVPFSLYATETLERAPFIFSDDNPWANLPLIAFCAAVLAFFIAILPLMITARRQRRARGSFQTIQLPPWAS